MSPDGLPEPIEVAVAFTQILDDMSVPHVIGGSLASSVHGEPRATNDIDIMADLRLTHVDPLVTAVTTDFYVSADAARQAIRARGSFNLINLRKAVKVDVFIAGDDPLNAARLKARERVRVFSDPEAWLFIDTPEHSVLRKLDWYRRGGGVSERQWRDVLGIIRIQGDRLDQGELDAWAERLGLRDLLQLARATARPNT